MNDRESLTPGEVRVRALELKFAPLHGGHHACFEPSKDPQLSHPTRRQVADFPFDSTCKRAENGFSPGACNFDIPTNMPMTPLHYVVDVEAGIAAGFVLFGGRSSGMDDFHMFA